MAGDKILAADARHHARLAALLASSSKYESAAAHYRRALRGLEEQPAAGPEREAATRRQRLRWQFELAAAETKLGHRRDAIKLYEEILETDPAYVEARVNLAAQLAIVDASRLDEALDLCMQALAERPDFPEAHYNRNMLLRRLGRQEEAVRVYWGYLALDLGQDAVREKMPDELARAVLPAHGEGSVPKPSSMRAVDDLCNQEDENDGVTVVCVKWGTKYGPGYVNKLYNSVMRHSGDLAPTQVTFVCLTDDSEGIELHETMHILPLSDGWKGWWNKCQLFSSQVSAKLRELGHSRCLYLDLDTVIVGTLSDLLMVSPRSGVLALLKTDQMTNEQREGGFNSSIMAWHNENAKSLQFLHSFLQDNFFAVSKYIYKFDHWLEMAHPQARFLEDIFPGQIVEYRSLDEKAAMPPTNASVVCFPLQPKPHTATAQWVAKHWI